MDDLKLNISNNIDPIDCIQVKNKRAVFSTIPNDVIFGINKINNPIFCGGFINQLDQSVYDFKKNDFVVYLSHQKTDIINLSSNLVIKQNNINPELSVILPYASFAMKILREINPKIGQNILIIGLNILSLLLLKLFKLTGSSPLIIDIDADTNNIKINKQTQEWIISGLNQAKSVLNNTHIDSIIIITSLRKNLDDFLKEIIYRKIIHLNEFSIYDKGLQDVNYLRGIKYPYSYVRWDFKRNLSYFINIFERGLLNLDFIDYTLLEVDSSKEISEKIPGLRNKSLILFSIK